MVDRALVNEAQAQIPMEIFSPSPRLRPLIVRASDMLLRGSDEAWRRQREEEILHGASGR